MAVLIKVEVTTINDRWQHQCQLKLSVMVVVQSIFHPAMNYSCFELDVQFHIGVGLCTYSELAKGEWSTHLAILFRGSKFK